MAKRRSANPLGPVLVADDHGVTRFGLVSFLRDKLDAPVTHEARRFAEALDILRAHPIELAIFDLDMPGLSGPSQLSQVRDGWPAVKVVVLSGSDEREDILAALEAGVHGYVVKTESMDDLAERLAYVMSGEIYVPPTLAERVNAPAVTDLVVSVSDKANGPRLTERQRQVLHAIVQGQSNKQIANELELAIGTVKMHVSAVLSALGARNRLHAASLGRKLFE